MQSLLELKFWFFKGFWFGMVLVLFVFSSW